MAEISIIVPIYNKEKTLCKCLESIVNQSFTDIEIILVNDGSVDKSMLIIEQFLEQDSRIYLFSQENNGVSSARNKGIKEASGNYIMFIDADDCIAKDMCEKLYKAILSGAETAICGMEIDYYSNELVSNREIIKPDVKDIYSEKEYWDTWYKLFKNKLYLSPCCKLYSSKIVNENEIAFEQNVSIGEDMLFNIQYFKYSHKISFVNESLYYYRVENNDSLSHHFDINRLYNNDYLLYKMLELWKEVRNPIILLGASNYFFKSTMILIEKGILDKENILDKVMIHVKKSPQVEVLFSKRYKKDIETLLYIIAFRDMGKIGIKILAYIRIGLKRIRQTKLKRL